jgi:O-antigen ligase
MFGGAAGWIYGRPRLSAALLAVALVVFVATAGLGFATVARRMLSPATYRAENRLPQWHAAVVLFRESPILGQGPHSFRDLVTARHREPDFRRIQLKYAPYPHDIYLEALCGTGVCGLAALLWLMCTAAAALHRRRATPMARAALVSLAAFAAIGVVDLSLVKDWVQVAFWVPIAVAAGLSSGGDDEEATTLGRSAGDVAASASPPLPR